MASEKLFKGGVEIQDDTFILKVSKDHLLAMAVPKDAKAGATLNPQLLAHELKEHGVVYGVLAEPERLPDGSFCVAKGDPPAPGQDARVRLHVKPSMARSPKMKEGSKDQVDFRELGTIVNVAKDKLLLEKMPPTQGKAGKDVFGTGIPAKSGKDRKLKCGTGVYLSEDESKIFSKFDGKFLMADGKPSVYEEHVVKGDLDISVGNIAFGGANLVIQGEVLPGFSVKCRGNVLVQKGVTNAFVMAGGNLTVVGSAVGEQTVLRAKGTVTVDFMENGARVETASDLIVNDYIVQCRAMVGKNLIVKGKEKGVVIGGNYIVGGSMFAKELGAETEITTTVSVGIIPSLQAKKLQLDADLQLWSDRLNEIIKNISTLEKMKKELGAGFPQDKAVLLQKYTAAMPKAMERVNLLTEQTKAMEEDLEQMVNENVYVYGKLYPGVVIKIGSVTRVTTSEEEQCVAYYDKDTRQIFIRKMSRDERTQFEAL
ncbi:MAG: FapA family protein [Thermodesulfobacteriota bacterium]